MFLEESSDGRGEEGEVEELMMLGSDEGSLNLGEEEEEQEEEEEEEGGIDMELFKEG